MCRQLDVETSVDSKTDDVRLIGDTSVSESASERWVLSEPCPNMPFHGLSKEHAVQAADWRGAEGRASANSAAAPVVQDASPRINRTATGQDGLGLRHCSSHGVEGQLVGEPGEYR